MIFSVILIRPKSEGKKEIPHSLLYIGTALRNFGYKVKIVDLQDDIEGESDIENFIEEYENEIIVGITCMSPQYKWLKDFSLKIKKKFPKVPIVAGGHISISHNIVLSNTSVDFVCTGEGEITLIELIDAINRRKPFESVEGIAYKKDKIYVNKRRSLLDKFILPDYSIINLHSYIIHPNQDSFFRRSQRYKKIYSTKDKMATIMFSRGYIGFCGFCYRHLPGFRQGDIDWAWRHLMVLYKQYGIRFFRIDDELFTNDINWLKALQKKLEENNIKILFRLTGLRVDTVSDEILEILSSMGCIAINYGIESGSDAVLKKMNKGVSSGQNLSAINKTRKYNMLLMAYIMLGYQGETKSSLQETVKFLIKSDLKPHEISLFYTIPFPGTKIYYDSIREGLIKNEENFLDSLKTLLTKDKKIINHYRINLCGLNKIILEKYEKIILLTLKSNEVFNRNISYILFTVFNFLPANKSTYILFNLIYKILGLINRFKKNIYAKYFVHNSNL